MKEGIKVSEHEAQLIEARTRGQGNKWMREREMRLTSSNFGAICKLTERRDIEKFCESMHNPKDLSHVPAIRHGCTYESVALEKFSELTGKKLMKSGLYIHPHYPYLGASPDSVVVGEDAVVEVKCPHRGRKCKIEPGADFDFLEKVGDRMHLKKTHNYYYQITGQMKLSKRNEAYFVVYTFEDIFYEKIVLDNAFFMGCVLPKLTAFYNEHYCPYLASVMKNK